MPCPLTHTDLDHSALFTSVEQDSRPSHGRPPGQITAARSNRLSKAENQEERAVTRYNSVLAAISLTIAMVGSGAAQQASPTPEPTLPNERCPGCFAYLEFAPALEPEAYAMRGQATEASIALPPAPGEPDGPLREQSAVLAVSTNR